MVDQGMRVLLIEDNEVHATLMRKLLASASYPVAVETARTLGEGQRLNRAADFDAILLDLSLPDSTGIDTFMRLHESDQRTPIILLTGLNDEELALSAIKTGAQDYMVKGQVDGDSLLRSLRYGIERARLTAQLCEREAQLAQAHRLEAIGRLTAGVAHEIRGPMQYLGDNIRFLDETFERIDQLIAQYEKLLEAARAAAPAQAQSWGAAHADDEADVAHLRLEIEPAIRESLHGLGQVAEIVRSMYELAQPRAAQMTLVDVDKVITRAITFATNEWKYVAEIETDFEQDLPPIPVMEADLNHALLAVIVRAAKAVAETVEGSDDKGTITIRADRAGDAVEIRIADSGAIIPEEVQAHLFEERTPGGDSRSVDTGMVLARACIADAHGGTLGVESDAAHGTVFTIRLPIDQPTEYPEAAGPASDALAALAA